MLNKKIIVGVLGQLMFLEAILLTSCIGITIIYRESDYLTFGIPVLVALLLGIFFTAWGKDAKNSMGRRDGYLIVSVTWIIFSIVGMLPFLISGAEPRIAAAFFETMSGFTTTGATALSKNIDSLPHSILFWRSLMHWVGGIGIIFFTIAILPNTQAGEQKMFSAETTGLKIAKLHPRIRTTAHWIGGLYLSLTAICAVSLYFGGMNIFDAVNHAFSTMATGGFSTHEESIGWFHSQRIEYILMIFMFVAGINFTLLYLLIFKRRWRQVWEDKELHLYILLFMTVALICAITMIVRDDRPILDALHSAAFHTLSLQTTTGFTFEDFMTWHPAVWMFLLLITAIGACAGSTTGGIKTIRVLMVFKVTKNEFRQILHPHAVFPIRVNKTLIDNVVVKSIFVFFTCYFALLLIGTVLMMMMGIPMLDAVSCGVTALSNVGPGVGHMVGPLDSYTNYPDGALWINSFLMLAGRLEIFAILLPLVPEFWKKN